MSCHPFISIPGFSEPHTLSSPLARPLAVLTLDPSCLLSLSRPFGIKVVVTTRDKFQYNNDVFAVMVQYPDTNGTVEEWSDVAKKIHEVGGSMIVGSDLLALTLLKPPGEFGADVAYGSAQRFGIPMGEFDGAVGSGR